MMTFYRDLKIDLIASEPPHLNFLVISTVLVAQLLNFSTLTYYT